MNTQRLNELAAAFETRHRANGESYLCLKDDAPEWARDVVHHAHGDFLPNDWRHWLIGRVVEAMADVGWQDVERSRDWWDDASAQLTDIYNYPLLSWVSSSLIRMAYVDEAQETAGLEPHTPLARRLALGQHAELNEIFNLLLSCEELSDDFS